MRAVRGKQSDAGAEIAGAEMSQRKDQILAAFQGRADIAGLSKAVDELVEALEHAELRYDRLEKQMFRKIENNLIEYNTAAGIFSERQTGSSEKQDVTKFCHWRFRVATNGYTFTPQQKPRWWFPYWVLFDRWQQGYDTREQAQERINLFIELLKHEGPWRAM